MNAENVSPQDKLDQLYSEGRITREEYQRLGRSLEGDPGQAKIRISGNADQLPWQVWVSIGILTIAGLIQVPLFLSKNKPAIALGILGISVPVIYGLYKKHRWAFVVFVFLCFASLINLFNNPLATLINIGFGLILLTAYPYFFSRRNE